MDAELQLQDTDRVRRNSKEITMRKITVLSYANRGKNSPEWVQRISEAFAPNHDFRFPDLRNSLHRFADAEVVLDLGGWGTREMIDAARRARLWQIIGTGVEHMDLAYLKSKGIMAANCPGTSSCVGLAECAMMFILMLTRQWHSAQKNLAEGKYYEPIGRSLVGLTLAIVGFGASGRELARRAKSFGMRIEVIEVVQPDAQTLTDLQPDFVGTPDDLDRVIARCDFLSVHLHLNANTRHMIDARRIALMKPSACIINVARGELVDEAAMHRALLTGTLGGAGLDVFGEEPPDMSEPAFHLPNVFLTPHISGATDDTLRRRVAMVLDNMERFADGREILYRVA